MTFELCFEYNALGYSNGVGSVKNWYELSRDSSPPMVSKLEDRRGRLLFLRLVLSIERNIKLIGAISLLCSGTLLSLLML